MKDKTKFIFTLGTRPEVIKSFSLIKELQLRGKEVYVLNTGQQSLLTKDFLDTFKVRTSKDFVLGDIRSLNNDLSSVISNLHAELSNYPATNTVIFVQGDTTTALGGALVGFNLRIPVFHIEAGLRTWDMHNPYPEEIYRRLITQLSSHHFAPTKNAKNNLLKSGVKLRDITVCGNTGIDALAITLESTAEQKLESNQNVLITLHRRENLGETIRDITLMISELTKDFPDVKFHFMRHTNPAVVNSYHPEFIKNSGIKKYEPQDYQTTIKLLKSADLVITDSGGIQEESAYLGIPLIVARASTERDEVLTLNCVICSTESKLIKEAVIDILKDKSVQQRFMKSSLVYGDGKSAARIVKKLESLGLI